MMDVKAFGPARVLHNKDFRSASNFITGFDIVPLADPVGLVRGLTNGNVHYLPSVGCPVVDHFFDNKRFSDMQKVTGDQYKKAYGEVW